MPLVQYPSLNTPADEIPPVDLESRLPVPIDPVTTNDKAQVSPVDASETVLVTVPGAIAHLVDREASSHLASGPFSLVRLNQGRNGINQGGNGIAVLARIGKKLQWPVTKDQAAVKLDPYHYFFSVMVPPEIEKECRSSSPEKRITMENTSPPASEDNLLNYGITFSSSSDMSCLQQLDDVLKQYSCCKVPQVTLQGEDLGVSNKSKGGVVDNDRNLNEDSAIAGLKEVPGEEFWTMLAPYVEDYSSSAARAIASGEGQIIRGIFWCSDATIAQLQKGSYFMQGRIKAKDAPTKMSPSAMRRIKRVEKISAMSEQIVTGVLSGVVRAAVFITRPLVSSTVGQKLLRLRPAQVALASLHGSGKISGALEEAGKNVFTTTSIATTGLVAKRYGTEAGEFTEQGFNAVGGFLTTAWTVAKLRKVFYPTSLVKSAAKVAGDERRLKDQSVRDGQSVKDGQIVEVEKYASKSK